MKLSEKLSDTAKLRIANMLLEQLENDKRSHITECEGDEGNMYFLLTVKILKNLAMHVHLLSLLSKKAASQTV